MVMDHVMYDGKRPCEARVGTAAAVPESFFSAVALVSCYETSDFFFLLSFVWPWQIKLTVQKEVAGGAVLQQSFVCEFIVRNRQCGELQ